MRLVCRSGINLTIWRRGVARTGGTHAVPGRSIHALAPSSRERDEALVLRARRAISEGRLTTIRHLAQKVASEGLVDPHLQQVNSGSADAATCSSSERATSASALPRSKCCTTASRTCRIGSLASIHADGVTRPSCTGPIVSATAWRTHARLELVSAETATLRSSTRLK